MRLNALLVAGALALVACAEAAPGPSSTTATTVAADAERAIPFETAEIENGLGLLLVLGDWGAGTKEQRAVAAAMESVAEEYPVAAIVTTGDNFYSNNAAKLLEPFDWAVDEIEFWIAWGNHDVQNRRRIDLVEEAFDDPPRWTVHRWGKVDVVILDSDQVTAKEQLAFLADAMESSHRPTVMVFHHPPLSCANYGDANAVLDHWVPLFDDGVVLVLSGHDHNYQRFEEEGTVYLVTGGGGRGLHGLKECSDDHPPRLAGAAVHHFLAMAQTDAGLTVVAIDTDGEVIDRVTVPLP